MAAAVPVAPAQITEPEEEPAPSEQPERAKSRKLWPTEEEQKAKFVHEVKKRARKEKGQRPLELEQPTETENEQED